MEVKFIIRNSYPSVPVVEILAGPISDGQFKPDPVVISRVVREFGLEKFVRSDDLFSGSAYASFKDVPAIINRLTDDCLQLEYYGSFMVFTINIVCDVASEEKEG